MTVAPVSEGDVLVGKYRVDRVLGVGGMGVVVAATHLQLEQKVALKFMLPDAFANPEVPKAALHFVAWIYITPELKQVTLPPGVLVPGHTYEFQIIAGTTTTPSTAPLLSGYPICNANTVTGLYVP